MMMRGHAGIEIGSLSKSSGSAMVQLGSTQVVAAVHGPKAMDRRGGLQQRAQLRVSLEHASFSGRGPPGRGKVRTNIPATTT